MNIRSGLPAPPPLRLAETLFSVATGLLLAVALLKFGNPVILLETGSRFAPQLGHLDPVERGSIWFEPWSPQVLYVLLAGVFVLSWRFWKLGFLAPKWLLLMPLLWLAAQCWATVYSVQPSLSGVTVLHFASCVACFYLGLFAVARLELLFPLRMMVLGGFCGTLMVGWYQHWVGFEETRRFFYTLPNWQDFPSAFREKLASNRVFGTLLYPNAFAGAILLFLPFALNVVQETMTATSKGVRWLSLLAVGGAAAGALYWSGSKGAWLISLLLLVVVCGRSPLSRPKKLTAMALVIVVGVSAFLIRHQVYFSRGATSVTARMDYWRAALGVVRQHPLFGSGPGTFMVEYAKALPPGAEMTRLAHNDYLQQASDSGVIGFVGYLVLTWGLVMWRYRQRFNSETFAIWLGVLGLSVQACFEFPLYIPALSWTYFLFLGWLCGGVTRERGKIEI